MRDISKAHKSAAEKVLQTMNRQLPGFEFDDGYPEQLDDGDSAVAVRRSGVGVVFRLPKDITGEFDWRVDLCASQALRTYHKATE